VPDDVWATLPQFAPLRVEYLCISSNCPSQAEICVDFLVSNALPGLDTFLVQAYYDIHCSDEIWERIKDVIPKYDEIEVTQDVLVSVLKHFVSQDHVTNHFPHDDNNDDLLAAKYLVLV